MFNPKDYTVGWLCAISMEYVAAQAFLDEKHKGPEYLSQNDNNDYTLGRIGKHNVVIAVLPDGEYGTSSAASVARDMLHSFPNVRIGLMVGIGGGAPSRKHDIRLGDIVVSAPRDGKGGVFQYDFGKTIQDQSFRPTGFLNQPPMVLRTAVSGLKTQYESEGHQLEEAINRILEKKPRLQQKYKRPDLSSDRLYQSVVIHPLNDDTNCGAVCGDDPSNLILRPERTAYEDNPAVHYGLISSANQLMKDALLRDKFAVENDVLCFEMEAAGLINHFPCLVIRGICDYSDSHKNKEWQGYAAMVAAAYTKDLLCRIAPNRIEAEKKIGDILSGVKEGLTVISRDVDKLLCMRHDQEHQAILNWLTATDYSSQQSDFIERRQEGTGEWLLKSNEFQEWINQKQILFCPGIPGAGKTIATSIVIDHLYRKFLEDTSVGIAYLYCNFRRQQEQHLTDLLLSLLKQFAHPSVPKTVISLYEYHKGKGTRPSIAEILKVLYTVVAGYARAFIVIDALDECQVSDGTRDKFLSEIFQLQAKTGVNFFATSRFIPDIRVEFERRESILLEIRARDGDVRSYLEGHMSRLPSFVKRQPNLQEEIKTEIARAVDGMFLLAQLYLDSLIGKISPKSIKTALQNLRKRSKSSNNNDDSNPLYLAYEEAMKRIKSQHGDFPKLATMVLSWITFTERPLTIPELQHALAVEVGAAKLDEENLPDTEDMVSVCCGLVTIDEKSDTIRLVHYTTQEYFGRTWETWFPDAHTDITEKCVTYLSFEVFETGFSPSRKAFKERLESNVLYSYAARYWGYHAHKSSIEGEMLILDLLESTMKVSACSQAMIYDGSYTRMTGLHLAAYFGLEKSTSDLLKRVHDIDPEDLTGRNPLSWAAENGHEAVVKLLLEKNADIESKDSVYGRIPLSWAAENGHEAVVKLLLEKNADIESKDSVYGRTPLSWAAENGHEAVVKLLLEKNADIESKDSVFGRTLLSLAAMRGHEAVVKVLLEKNADIESKDDKYGLTPLSWAAENGHEAVVKLLLEKNADIESENRISGQTPLLRAAEKGHEAVMKLLLEKNADIESENRISGRTPLSWAAEKGHEAVVKLLLEKNAYIESYDRFSGQTPLLRAAKNGHEAVVKLLLEKNADVESKNNDSGLTPLSWAAMGGHEAVVKLLLEKNADVEFKENEFGRTPLSWAAMWGHEAVVKLIREAKSSRLSV